MSEKKFPTWGYRRGEAKIFNLGEGEKLPPGWSDDPAKANEAATPVPPEPKPAPKSEQPPAAEEKPKQREVGDVKSTYRTGKL